MAIFWERRRKTEGFKVEVIPIIYYKNTSLERAIDRLFVEVDRAYRDGVNIMILSDRGVDENHVAIPSLLAVSALNRHLVVTKKKTSVALVLESGEPREVHHFATLLGYGACAVNPYLAQESIKELIDSHMLDKDYYAAVEDYNNAILHGIVKIASKMGISTIQSYEGSQIFEAIGIDREVIITKCAAVQMSIFIIRQPYISFRNPRNAGIMRCLNSIPHLSMTKIPLRTCAVLWTLIIRKKGFP